MTSGIVDRLRSCRTVHVDTQAIIYFLERRSPWDAIVRDVFQLIDAGELKGTSSSLTLMEVLVLPLRQGRIDLAEQYTSILTDSRSFELMVVDARIAETAAQVRARYASFKSPDAIQIASALVADAGAFITNDVQLHGFAGLPGFKTLDILLLRDFDRPPTA